MNTNRRWMLKSIAALAACVTVRAFGDTSAQSIASNFTYIYRDTNARAAFFPFLENVFHLFPAKQLHHNVLVAAQKFETDQAIYQYLQTRLGNIKPLLGDLTYALPALAKQKAVITAQTRTLLPQVKTIDGYLELGSSGRYLDALEEEFAIEGPRYCISDPVASYSLIDIIDRGQIAKAGDSIALANYNVDFTQAIAPNSLSLITVYIGLHHCPVHLRDSFVAGLRHCLKPGGHLIIRDHNAHNQAMQHVVALAHDIFNMGTNETWAYNKSELRHFYDLAFLDRWLEGSGFKKRSRPLFQEGDPTLNALLHYQKV